MKLVINSVAGGFGLSPLAQIALYLQESEAIQAVPAGVLPFPESDATSIKEHPGFRIFPRYDMVITPAGELLQTPSLWDMAWRRCPKLVALVEADAAAASGSHACLKVIEVPDDIDVDIRLGETGTEWIAERHRTWH